MGLGSGPGLRPRAARRARAPGQLCKAREQNKLMFHGEGPPATRAWGGWSAGPGPGPRTARTAGFLKARGSGRSAGPRAPAGSSAGRQRLHKEAAGIGARQLGRWLQRFGA